MSTEEQENGFNLFDTYEVSGGEMESGTAIETRVEDKPERIEGEYIDIGKILPRQEHGIYAYYGRIGQGKTYAMTADVIEALKRGRVVYTNYPINWNGFDQRTSIFWLFLGVLGIKRKFLRFKPDNLHRIEIDDQFHDNLAKITDAIVALDEGYVVMDSYEMTRMSMKKRKNVLHTRHFDRSIWYTTQRPTGVHVTLRSQTNVFYKVQKLLTWPFVVFRRQEFDLASDESVDESKPLSTKLYLGKPFIFHAYDTKYLRYGANASQNNSFDLIPVSYFERIVRLTFEILTFLGLKTEKSYPQVIPSSNQKNLT